MADNRVSFPSLEDASGIGAPLTKSEAGDAASGKVGSVAFAFKDSSGNIVLPQLTAAGKILVDSEASNGINLKNRAENAAGSLTVITLSNITLTVNKVYDEIKGVVSSRKGAILQLIQNDNAVETVLADFIVDAGQYSFMFDFGEMKFTAGATGTQELKIKAYNFDKVSALRSTLSCLET